LVPLVDKGSSDKNFPSSCNQSQFSLYNSTSRSLTSTAGCYDDDDWKNDETWGNWSPIDNYDEEVLDDDEEKNHNDKRDKEFCDTRKELLQDESDFFEVDEENEQFRVAKKELLQCESVFSGVDKENKQLCVAKQELLQYETIFGREERISYITECVITNFAKINNVKYPQESRDKFKNTLRTFFNDMSVEDMLDFCQKLLGYEYNASNTVCFSWNKMDLTMFDNYINFEPWTIFRQDNPINISEYTFAVGRSKFPTSGDTASNLYLLNFVSLDCCSAMLNSVESSVNATYERLNVSGYFVGYICKFINPRLKSIIVSTYEALIRYCIMDLISNLFQI
jgi:hypothetical protein